MSGSINGAIKAAAARLGMASPDYIRRMAAGEKYCYRCQAWHHKSAFGPDRARGDGLAAQCRASRKAPVRQ